MEDDFVVARAPERYAPAAHTLTEALLPTTCVVVNKPPALKHFPTIGLTPDCQKVVHAYREIAAGASRSPGHFPDSWHCGFDATEKRKKLRPSSASRKPRAEGCFFRDFTQSRVNRAYEGRCLFAPVLSERSNPQSGAFPIEAVLRMSLHAPPPFQALRLRHGETLIRENPEYETFL